MFGRSKKEVVSPYNLVCRAINNAWIAEGKCVDIRREDGLVVQVCNFEDNKEMFVSDGRYSFVVAPNPESEWQLSVRTWPNGTQICSAEGESMKRVLTAGRRYWGLVEGDKGYVQTLIAMRI